MPRAPLRGGAFPAEYRKLVGERKHVGNVPCHPLGLSLLVQTELGLPRDVQHPGCDQQRNQSGQRRRYDQLCANPHGPPEVEVLLHQTHRTRYGLAQQCRFDAP